ncbi:oxysterol-binding protein-related protein 6-like [Onthophagus taurus]|uniref:oxysterol-binding protein-related protein 6-like n=1 Tax=Onthophagus taurus TaxID=166361 RepID=UPI000C2096B7|nr:oxysterol-binding protein-related protein 3-like [Onthophagus taurus]
MEKRKSPMASKINKLKGNVANTSDSDASADTNSLSAESTNVEQQIQQAPKPPARKKGHRRSSEWEIMEGLKEGQKCEKKPVKFYGYLHKKRKWPLKGWHKRYFILDEGILVYGKGPSEINRGKIHGSLDIGLSVISSKTKRRRIDIDAEEFIYHLKAKTEEIFLSWVQQLTSHRLYRQHVLTYGKGYVNSNTDDRNLPLTPEIVSRDGSLTRGLKPIGSARLATWLHDSGPIIDQIQRDLGIVEVNIAQLKRLCENRDSQFGVNTCGLGETESLGEGLSPSIKKSKKFGLKKKKSNKGGSVDLTMSFNKSMVIDPDISPLSNNSTLGVVIPQTPTISNPVSNNTSSMSFTTATLCLPTENCNVDRYSCGIVDNQSRSDFVVLAKNVVSVLKNIAASLGTERDRLKTAIELESSVQNMSMGVSPAVVASLKASLQQALQQNTELKNRLTKVHDVSDVNDLSALEPVSEGRPFNNSLSYSSSCMSGSEFFDAEDLAYDKHIIETGDEIQVEDLEAEIRTRGSDSSSEAGSLTSGEGSISSGSDLGHEFNQANNLSEIEGKSYGLTGRRTELAAPRPDTEGLSLWNLLCKNIGKDLSQISMPVALNEPLNMLQRLCEDLEYSELLDKAAEIDDPYERMVHVAAFAVSAYASSLTRAGNKPFNPLLGETYECTREDKGFRFIAEQVSHHPPISACHAESRNFTFWQEARIKTKFWGKSMEFQPMGKVYVMLPKTGDLYSWNKVTTCVHNLFSSQRWVDQYGELYITNGRISCKITFSKASYWSAKRHEILGAVYDENGDQIYKLSGKWSEALYCGVAPAAKCIWRAGTLPPNHDRYYGFTRFALELNELGPEGHLLPPTDTRLRPDQRALENGDLKKAESLKMQLETAQRERRKRREELRSHYEPLWFSHKKDDKEDIWEYNGKYWEVRKNKGFGNISFEPLW